jgi:KaiC/GvpD/RAD55 family RecA-like ATPase
MIEFEDHVKAHQAAPILGKTLTDFLTAPSQETSLSTKRLDMPKAMASVQANDHWHDNTLRLVARLVSDGLKDEEILARAGEFRCDGYTIQETIRELQVMVNGARRKGFDQKKLQPTIIGEANRLVSREPLLRRLSDITLEPIQFLVHDLLPHGSLSMLFGDPACGKSFVAIDIAMCVATGTSFHGKSVTKGAVIYIAGEGYRGLTQRAWAWLSENEISMDVAEIFISRTSVDIPDDDAREKLTSEIHSLLGEEGKPALIVLDTVARNFGGNDENSTKDMSAFITAVDAINAEFDCATLLVHHTGHADKTRARGAIALKGALDTEYRLAKYDAFLTLECTKAKDFEEPKGMRFMLKPVELQSGKEIIESAVIKLRDDAFERKRLTKGDQRYLRSFFKAYDHNYADRQPGQPISLHLEEWRDYYLVRSPADKHESKMKDFLRCRTALVNKDVLTVLDDVYTWTPLTYQTCPGQPSDMSDEHHETDRTDTDTRL